MSVNSTCSPLYITVLYSYSIVITIVVAFFYSVVMTFSYVRVLFFLYFFIMFIEKNLLISVVILTTLIITFFSINSMFRHTHVSIYVGFYGKIRLHNSSKVCM